MLSLFKFLFYYGLLSLSLLSPALARDLPFSAQDLTGIFWQIKKPGQANSYLLGTMHTDDPRVLTLPEPIQTQFDQADSASFEILMDVSTLMHSMQAMFLASGETLASVIDDPDYYQDLIARLAQQGMPELAIKQLKPWAIMVLVSMPKNNSGQFLDLVLYQAAVQQNKTVHGLETVQEQLQFFEQLSIDDQLILLEETLKHLAQMPEFFEHLHTLYLDRALGEMFHFYQDYMNTSEHEALMNDFHRSLLDERNQRMLERMQPRLAEGNAFIAVGALHLPGPQGLLHLLQQEGYRVSVIY